MCISWAADGGAHRLAIGPVGGHRVPGVAAEDDAGAEGDVLAGQAVGVAEAVPALVGVAHQRQHVGQELDRGQDALADHRCAAGAARAPRRSARRACSASPRGSPACRCRGTRRRGAAAAATPRRGPSARPPPRRAARCRASGWRCRSPWPPARPTGPPPCPGTPARGARRGRAEPSADPSSSATVLISRRSCSSKAAGSRASRLITPQGSPSTRTGHVQLRAHARGRARTRGSRARPARRRPSPGAALAGSGRSGRLRAAGTSRS